jgi:hypothetical protein
MLLKKTAFINGNFEQYPDITIPYVGEVHLSGWVSVTKVGTLCQIKSSEPIRINNQAFVGEKLLTHNTVIEVGKDIYVFKDEVAQAAFATIPGKQEEKIQHVAEIEKRYSVTSLRALKAKHFKLFWSDGKAKRDMKTLVNRLIQYATKKLAWERAILLRVLGKDGVAIASKGLPKGFAVPKALIFPAWRAKKAMKFSLKEAEEEEKNISLSIRERKVEYSMIVPFSSSERLVAFLYVDSTSPKINDSSYFLLAHICQEISTTLAEMLDFPELKEVHL